MITNLGILFIIAVVAAFGFAIMLDCPVKIAVFASALAGIGWLIHESLLPEFSIIKAYLISSIVVAFLSNIFSRALKSPITAFYIIGYITSVPGSDLYKMTLALMQGEFPSTLASLSATLQKAGAIVIAIFLMDALFTIISRLSIRFSRYSDNKVDDYDEEDLEDPKA